MTTSSPSPVFPSRSREEFGHLLQFLLVGASGVAVNLGVFTILLKLAVPIASATAIAIAAAMISNFALNRRFTFSYARHQPIWRQFFGFVAACLIGALISYGTTLLIISHWPHVLPQLAAFAGIVLGTGFNFIGSRLVVFRKSHL